MCGRFAQGEFPTKLRRIMRELYDEIYGQNLNLAPSEAASVVVQEGDLAAVVRRMEFGIVPSWNPTSRLINARSETVATKPSFRQAFQHRRCLVPALGFYEWRRDAGGKTPFYFSATDEERPLVMGGIWEVLNSSYSFSILTTAANGTMQPIHDRMPVIITPDRWTDWLNPTQTDTSFLSDFLHPIPDDYLRRCEVSPYVNAPSHKGAECNKPIA